MNSKTFPHPAAMSPTASPDTAGASKNENAGRAVCKQRAPGFWGGFGRAATKGSSPREPRHLPDPEYLANQSAGPATLAFAWLVFQAVIVWTSVITWLTWQRQCAWCQCRLGGNPLSRRVTHGICPCCQKDFLAGFNAVKKS